MLRLRNVKINGKTAEADFYPEDEKTCGHIVVDLETEEILDIVHVEGYRFMYPSHACQRLIEIAKGGKDIRDEYLVMWY